MKRVGELDGLRGLAAVIVLLSHYFGEVPHGTRFVTVGWLGVDIFFVLSGFLIGSIILDQHTQANFFKSFYLRRAARIVPVYFVVCAATLTAAHALSGHSWSDHPFNPIVYAAFVSNIAISIWGGGGEWLRPTWTLAVEEQFYLILPLLIVVTPRKLLRPLLIGLWLCAVGLRAELGRTSPLAALTLLPCRMDLLLAGVLAADINRNFDLSRYLTVLRFVPSVAMFAIVGAVIYSGDYFFIVFSPAFMSIGVASFILAIIHHAPEGARFRSPALQYVGRISYTFYLIHQPIGGILHGVILGGTPDIGTLPQLAVTLLSLLASLALAAASWRWFEKPILDRAHAHHTALLGQVVASV